MNRITGAEFKKCISGYSVLGCAVRSREVLGFVLQERADAVATGTGFDGPLIGYSPTPHPHLMVAGVRGSTYVTGPGESFTSSRRSSGGPCQ